MVLLLIILAFSDLDWIQTSNLLSRNQVRYSVAPRGLFCGCKYSIFIKLLPNNLFQIYKMIIFGHDKFIITTKI